MSLLAEEVVEEWLNQQGFFTIRGIKLGVAEMDILAIRHTESGVDCRHYEVQASVNPIGYVTQVPKEEQRQGVSPNSAKSRDESQIRSGVQEWINKNFRDQKKSNLRQMLHFGPWHYFFVHGKVRHPEELDVFREHSDVQLVALDHVISQLKAGGISRYTASGKDLIDLIRLGGIT